MPHLVLEEAVRRQEATPAPLPQLASVSQQHQSFILAHSDNLSPDIQEYFSSISSALEKMYTRNAMLEKQNGKMRDLLAVKEKKRKATMSVKDIGQHLYSTEEILAKALEIEAERAAKKKGKGQGKRQQKGKGKAKAKAPVRKSVKGKGREMQPESEESEAEGENELEQESELEGDQDEEEEAEEEEEEEDPVVADIRNWCSVAVDRLGTPYSDEE